MKRMLAEWENPKKILMTLPGENTDWAYIIDEALFQFKMILDMLAAAGEEIILLSDGSSVANKLIEKTGVNPDSVITDIEFNDTWTRDYGCISVEEDGGIKELDFGFNGWGLKFASNHDNLVNLNLAEKGYRNPSLYQNHRDFTLEGGSIETDGKGTLLTTSRCLCSPNRNGGKSKEELEPILRNRLGVNHFLWLDYGFLAGDDTDSHIDTLARLAPDDTIIYVAPPQSAEDPHFNELTKMKDQLERFKTAEGTAFNLVPLPFPDPIYDDEGNRLPATYANYLVTAKNLFIPTYGHPEKDAEAIKSIGGAFPDKKIFTIDCRTLLKQHGSLHCSTMQLY